MLECIWFPYLNLPEPWNRVAVINCPTEAQLICPCMLSNPRRPETNEWPYDVSSSTESRKVHDCQPDWASPFPLVSSGAQDGVRGPGAPYLANSGHFLSPIISNKSKAVSRFCSIFPLLPTTMKTRPGGRHPRLYNKINATHHFYLFYTWPSLKWLGWDSSLVMMIGIPHHHQDQKAVANGQSYCWDFYICSTPIVGKPWSANQKYFGSN